MSTDQNRTMSTTVYPHPDSGLLPWSMTQDVEEYASEDTKIDVTTGGHLRISTPTRAAIFAAGMWVSVESGQAEEDADA